VAMLPNGPVWTSTGVPSRVWSRFGSKRVAKDRRHGPGPFDLLGRDGGAGTAVADHDAAEACPQVGEGVGQSEDRINLGGAVMSKPLWRVTPSRRRAEQGDDVRSESVVHGRVRAASDRRGVEVRGVALVEVVCRRGRRACCWPAVNRWKSPVRCRFHPLHGHDLAVAAAGRPTLDAEVWPHGGLTMLTVAERPMLRHGPGRGRWSPSSCPLRRGQAVMAGHENVLGPRAPGECVDGGELDLGHVVAVGQLLAPSPIRPPRRVVAARWHLGRSLGRRQRHDLSLCGVAKS